MRRVLWFIALWAAGVGTLAIVALIIRAAIVP
ncbi:DUF2474 domain-containing protein [Rhodovulum sp. FJ3]|nr:DUF2474 domain-containing protein [Rhodovulum sp. FJ3]MDV4168461.1 DUF2474 domain-containing protein [Rhodovulum sp. FJ3]